MKRNRGIGKALLAPAAGVFYLVVKIRHVLYNWGIISSMSPKVATICVGNLTVGGTGKTPHIELLIDLLRKKYKLAVLSRGYKRKTKGFQSVETSSTSAEVGDEPLQIKQKFPQISVAVDANRAEGINQLTFKDPSIDIILLDDAFQHRKVKAGFNIILIDFNRPIWEDTMLPIGNLRDTVDQLDRANIVIITKCLSDLTPLDKRLLSKKIRLYPYQKLLFSSIKYGTPEPLFDNAVPFKPSKKAVIIAGIAEPTPFINHVKTLATEVHPLIFPDHHQFALQDIYRIADAIPETADGINIFTTEKDAKRLIGMSLPEHIKKYLYFVPIKAHLSDDADEVLLNKIVRYVKENTGNSIVHKGTY